MFGGYDIKKNESCNNFKIIIFGHDFTCYEINSNVKYNSKFKFDVCHMFNENGYLTCFNHFSANSFNFISN